MIYTNAPKRMLTWLLLSQLVVGCARVPRSTPPTVAELYERAAVIGRESDAEGTAAVAETSSPGVRPESESTAFRLVSNGIEVAEPGRGEHVGSNVVVSEFFDDTDLNEALELLARQANVPLVIGEQVGGRTSAYIEDVPFEQALRQILLPLGYVFRYRDGAYYIGSLNSESNLFRYIATERSYQPAYLGAEELKEMLPRNLQDFVRVSDKRHMVRIEAPEEVAEGILRRLASYDQPVPQVTLEAIVCVISPNQSTQSGIDAGHAVAENGANLLDLGLNGLVFGGTISPYGVRNAFTNFAQTSALVRLLAQEGYLAIRAAPRVMARDGEKAEISIQRENYFAVQPTSSGASDIFVRQEIQQVQSGISLQLTPRILGDRITVTIDKAEVSEDVQFEGSASVVNNPYPQINRRTVSTTVEVRDGETIVIGGLVQKQTVDRMTRIPVLGQLPGIGKLFSTIERQDEEAEIVVFISPRLISRPEDCVEDEFADDDEQLVLPLLQQEVTPPAVELPEPLPQVDAPGVARLDD